jgi:L-lactate dehydrogenase complex protein LldG
LADSDAPASKEVFVAVDARSENGDKLSKPRSSVELFCEQVEGVGGHCVIVHSEVEAARALKGIVKSLQQTDTARRIVLSDAPLVAALMEQIEVDADEVSIVPTASDLFTYDIGITTAQTAITETGTLVLESDSERHRLVSLLPPIHIAIINAADICMTLGDALRRVRHDKTSNISRAITFITGPSRTADIELTLAIGVHGPKKLYVMVMTGGTD